MKTYSNKNSFAAFENLNAIPDGIPVMKFKQVTDSIELYRKMIAIAVAGNTIIVILGAVYL